MKIQSKTIIKQKVHNNVSVSGYQVTENVKSATNCKNSLYHNKKYTNRHRLLNLFSYGESTFLKKVAGPLLSTNKIGQLMMKHI
jgi:hypothetical protein